MCVSTFFSAIVMKKIGSVYVGHDLRLFYLKRLRFVCFFIFLSLGLCSGSV